jgi:hypothetical protein
MPLPPEGAAVAVREGVGATVGRMKGDVGDGWAGIVTGTAVGERVSAERVEVGCGEDDRGGCGVTITRTGVGVSVGAGRVGAAQAVRASSRASEVARGKGRIGRPPAFSE